MRASSLEDFFSDPEFPRSELRDLCLKLEQPSLQEIRDACADFARGGVDDDGPDDAGEEEDEREKYDQAIAKLQRERMTSEGDMPEVWKSKHEQEIDEAAEHRHEGQMHADFGEIIDEASLRSRRVKIQVCGRIIWNYPSEKAMARGGWLQFSIIARGTPFGEAVQLCRNWNEFWELNSLAVYQYFPM